MEVSAGSGVLPEGALRSWPSGTFLARLSNADRDRVLELGVLSTVCRGTQLLRGGETGTDVYVLLEGAVKITGNSGEGEPLLAIRVGGDLVGEMALLSTGVRSATVTACVATVVRHVASAVFVAFLQRHPEAKTHLAAMIVDRLRWADERRVDLALTDARTRVARVLLSLARHYGTDTGRGRELRVPLTQQEMATISGVRLSTLEKALRDLRVARVVASGHRHLLVTDMPALIRQAGTAST